LLSILFDCKDVKEIIDKGYENTLLLVTKAIDKIMLGGQDIIQDDLVVSKLLGQDIIKYRSLCPHVSAAIQLLTRINILQKVILSNTFTQTHSTKVLFAELHR